MPPVFISSTATAWNNGTSPKTTASIPVIIGDTLVAIEIFPGPTSTGGISGGGLNWVLRQEVTTAARCHIYLWTATATSTTSITVSFTGSGGDANNFGGIVYVVRDCGGIGVTGKADAADAASSLTLNCSQNSLVICGIGDFEAGVITGRVWRTINGITPTSGNLLETAATQSAGVYTIYSAYWNNTGLAGNKILGMTTPTAPDYSIVGVELKGR